jgi:hypothetical protein
MQGWQSASVLNARESHTATLLHDGRVLVHGGWEEIIPPGGEFPQTNILRTADLFHPDTNEWIETASTAIQRVGHTAHLLPTGSVPGSVLVVGGTNGRTSIKETELYNPSTNIWSFTGPLNFARQHHAATSLQDGKVLVAAGSIATGILSSVEIYDPTTQAWTASGNLIKPKLNATATLLSDGRVLIVGGFDTSPPPRFSVEIYDPITTFASTPAEGLLSGSRWGHTATLLSDGKVLVAGGALVEPPESTEVALISCEIFDPVTGHWSVTGNLNKPRMGHTATLLPGGNVMVVGGGYQENQVLPMQTPEFFNPTEGWIEGPDMSVPRSGASQTLLRRDLHGPLEIKVLVAGGRSSASTNTLDSAELFTSGEVVA